jgi:hypothetical protein
MMNAQLSFAFGSQLAALCFLGPGVAEGSRDDFENEQRYQTYAFSFAGAEDLEDLYDATLVVERRNAPSEPLDSVLRELGIEN